MSAIPDEVLRRLLACHVLADRFNGGADAPWLTGPRLIYFSKNDMEQREWCRDLPQWRITMWIHTREGVPAGDILEALQKVLPDGTYWKDAPPETIGIDTFEWDWRE